jgi:hypothetical protein
MTHDELLVLSLLVAFATFVTAHLALVFGLALRKPWWRALLALPFAPLAPYWGVRAGMYVRAVVWVVSALAYLALRPVAF